MSSKSPPSSSSTSKKLTCDFVEWVVRWAKNEDYLDKESAIDIPDVVPLFQALGFTCKALPNPSSTAKRVYKEVQISIECKHSKHKIVLVKPLTADECKCEILGDAFWKGQDLTTAVYESSVKDIVPPMPNELTRFFKPVINQLLNMLRSNTLEPNQAEANSERKTILFKNLFK